MNTKGLKILAVILLLLLCVLIGVKSFVLNEPTGSANILDVNIIESIPDKVEVVDDIQFIAEEEVEEVTTVIIEVEEPIEESSTLEIADIEESSVDVVVIKESVSEEVVTESTMSCPLEDVLIVEVTKEEAEQLLTYGGVLTVGGLNSKLNKGTLLYALPTFRLDTFRSEGLGFGGHLGVGAGIYRTPVIKVSALLGPTYAVKLSDYTIVLNGGLYGAYTGFVRDSNWNSAGTLGIGGDFKLGIPWKDNTVYLTLGVESGLIGNPEGNITIGFVLNY